MFELEDSTIRSELANEKSCEREDEEIVAMKVAELGEWAKQQTRLPPSISDDTLRLFLHSCYYNSDRTKDTLIAYYTLRMKAPEFFANRNPDAENILAVSKNAYVVALPGTTDEGYKVILMGFFHSDTSDYVYVDTMKRFMMVMDMWILKNGQSSGYILLVDCANAAFAHFSSASFQNLKNFCTYFQEALPVRLQAVILINLSPAVCTLLNVVKPILSPRLSKMICKYSRGDLSYLKMVPQTMLPEDLDGPCKSIQLMLRDTEKELSENASWFQKEDNIVEELIQSQLSAKQ